MKNFLIGLIPFIAFGAVLGYAIHSAKQRPASAEMVQMPSAADQKRSYCRQVADAVVPRIRSDMDNQAFRAAYSGCLRGA